jgi:RHS repeat-associated protein
MAARLTRLVVALGLLLGAVLPSAAGALVRPPTSHETVISLVPDRGADPANARSYFGARYYRADLARFTTVDPVYTWQENLADPQRWNRYAYARNNPLRWVDPTGKTTEDPDDQMTCLAIFGPVET